MKRYLILALTITCISCSSGSVDHVAESRRAIDVFSSLNEEFQLHLIDHKIIRTPKIKKISVDFYHFGEIDIRQARLIIHHTAEQLLDSFNTLYSDRHSYHHFPLNQKDLEISISFVDPSTHKMHSDGAISHAALIGGRVHYSKYVDSEEGHQTVLQESFVEVKK